MKKLLVAMVILIVLGGTSFAGSLTLTSPNGGEKLDLGSTVLITWTVTGLSAKTVKLQLLEGGTVLGEIAKGIPATQGRHSWKVGELLGGQPPRVGDTFHIRVKVQGSDNADKSDGAFRIGMSSMMGKIQVKPSSADAPSEAGSTARDLTALSPSSREMTKTPINPAQHVSFESQGLWVTTPREGDRWAEGETRLIEWTSNTGGPYRIELHKPGQNSGTTRKVHDVTEVQHPIHSASGQYQYRWTIPSDAVEWGGTYMVRIEMGGNQATSRTFRLDNRLAMDHKTYSVPLDISNVQWVVVSWDADDPSVYGFPHPGNEVLKVGIENRWSDEDSWSYYIFRSHLVADVSRFKGRGLLVRAQLHFTRGSGCDPTPIVHKLDDRWNGTREHFMSIPVSLIDPENLTSTVVKWLNSPMENHGLMVNSKLEYTPLPWTRDSSCVDYFRDAFLELEFVESAD